MRDEIEQYRFVNDEKNKQIDVLTSENHELLVMLYEDE